LTCIILFVTSLIMLIASMTSDVDMEFYTPKYPCKISDLPGDADDLWLIRPGGKILKWR